jgi:hypothetical protein
MYEFGRFPLTRWLTEWWSALVCTEGFTRCFVEHSPHLIISVHPLCQELPLKASYIVDSTAQYTLFFMHCCDIHSFEQINSLLRELLVVHARWYC